jgi:hypothetical protein
MFFYTIANIANHAICISLTLAGDRKSPDFYRIKAGLSNYLIMSYIGFKVIISGQGLDINATSVFIQHLT